MSETEGRSVDSPKESSVQPGGTLAELGVPRGGTESSKEKYQQPRPLVLGSGGLMAHDESPSNIKSSPQAGGTNLIHVLTC